MGQKRTTLDGIIGLVTVGSAVSGVAGFLAALIAFFNADFVATGVCLVAAALSFGLLAIAVFQN